MPGGIQHIEAQSRGLRRSSEISPIIPSTVSKHTSVASGNPCKADAGTSSLGIAKNPPTRTSGHGQRRTVRPGLQPHGFAALFSGALFVVVLVVMGPHLAAGRDHVQKIHVGSSQLEPGHRDPIGLRLQAIRQGLKPCSRLSPKAWCSCLSSSRS